MKRKPLSVGSKFPYLLLGGTRIHKDIFKCFRTEKELDIFSSINKILDTAQKNKIKRLDMIKAVHNGTADDIFARVLVELY